MNLHTILTINHDSHEPPSHTHEVFDVTLFVVNLYAIIFPKMEFPESAKSTLGGEVE